MSVDKKGPSLKKQYFYSLGSLHLRLDAGNSEHKKKFEELFRVWPRTPRPRALLDATLTISESSAPFKKIPKAGAQPIFQSEKTGELTIRTDSTFSTFDLRKKPIRGRIVIRPEAPFYDDYPHYLLVAFNKFLFLTGRIHIHAAAVNYHKRTCLFIGEKGSGKTTISLALAKAGGIILAEDHVMLRQADGRYWVSGCDGRMRITEKTEMHFFPQGIDVAAQDFAGEMKKEFDLANYFETDPYKDYPVDLIFFPQKAEKFSFGKMRTFDAVDNLIGRLRNRHRFADPSEILDFVQYLRGLFDQSAPYHMNLSTDLRDLEKIMIAIEGINENNSMAR